MDAAGTEIGLSRDELTQLIHDRAADLAAALTKRPCHITGLHKPDHHVTHSCSDMRSDTLERALDVLGLGYADLPNELHPSCGWCSDVSSQEEYRARLRESWQWAGIPLTPELAADAPDKPQPGDPDFVFAIIENMQAETTGWIDWGDVVKRSEFPGHRCGKAMALLVEMGMLEQRSHHYHSQVRLPSNDA